MRVALLLKQSYFAKTILDESRTAYRLQGQRAKAFQDAIDNYNVSNTKLRFVAGGTAIWHFTFKNHALTHIAIDAETMSPRLCN
eukprot:6426037-Amphidinium_carterae.1